MAHKNWLNDTARQLNKKIYERRQSGPSTTTIYNWQQEWRTLGLDFKMSFYEYKKKKLSEWHSKRQLAKNKKRK